MTTVREVMKTIGRASEDFGEARDRADGVLANSALGGARTPAQADAHLVAFAAALDDADRAISRLSAATPALPAVIELELAATIAWALEWVRSRRQALADATAEHESEARN